MFEIIRNIILLLLLLTIIVSLHELGHLIAAKVFGVYCSEYSIGMGPKLYEKKFKETSFCIRAFPIGGFVAMAGDDNETGGTEDLDLPVERTMQGIAKWKRIIIMLAGIMMNILLAIFIYSMIIFSNGQYATDAKPVISEIMENYPAEQSELKVGDIITEVTFDNGAVLKPDSYSEISVFSSSYYDGLGPWHMKVLRDNNTLNIDVNPTYNEDEQRYVIGIVFSNEAVEIIDINFFNSFKYGFLYTIFVLKNVIVALVSLFKGIGLDNLSGPVGMYSIVSESVEYGFDYYIQIVALVSANIAMFNAIPLPIFDGGRVLLLFIEVIIGRPINKKVEEYIMSACVVILIMLMIFTTSNDIYKLLGR